MAWLAHTACWHAVMRVECPPLATPSVTQAHGCAPYITHCTCCVTNHALNAGMSCVSLPFERNCQLTTSPHAPVYGIRSVSSSLQGGGFRRSIIPPPNDDARWVPASPNSNPPQQCSAQLDKLA